MTLGGGWDGSLATFLAVRRLALGESLVDKWEQLLVFWGRTSSDRVEFRVRARVGVEVGVRVRVRVGVRVRVRVRVRVGARVRARFEPESGRAG